MDYKCSICGENVGDELLVFIDHTDDHIMDAIKSKHPEWVKENGVCSACEEYYRTQLKGSNSD